MDFLDHLATRALGRSGVARPMLASPFEPPGGEDWGTVDEVHDFDTGPVMLGPAGAGEVALEQDDPPFTPPRRQNVRERNVGDASVVDDLDPPPRSRRRPRTASSPSVAPSRLIETRAGDEAAAVSAGAEPKSASLPRAASRARVAFAAPAVAVRRPEVQRGSRRATPPPAPAVDLPADSVTEPQRAGALVGPDAERGTLENSFVPTRWRDVAPSRRRSGRERARDPLAEPAEPAVKVTIGRVEVRAVMAATPRPEREAAPSPHLSLDDYLARRPST